MRYLRNSIWTWVAYWALAGLTTLSAAEVWVSILPQKTLVEAIGGEFVTVQVLVRPGQSPELYAPSAAQLARLSRATAYVGIGVPVEQRVLPRIAQTMPGVRILQTGELAEHAHHAHDAHDACVHGDVDPHVWMDPVWVQQMLPQVLQLLKELEPAHAAYFEAQVADLQQQLQQVHERIAAQLRPYVGRAFYINHPSLGHFAQRYGLKQLSIEHAGSAPSARRVAELVKQAKAEQVGGVFTQPEFGRSGAAVLARALGVELMEVDPLAADYFQNLRTIADHLEQSFKK